MRHIAIYLSNASDKQELIERIIENDFLSEYLPLKNKRSALFSNITIEKIIDGEYRHDFFPITTDENKSLASMSSGQQRKALLSYLLGQKPDFMILDDVISSIDPLTQAFLIERLTEASQETDIVQLFFRKQDVLPFINKVLTIDTEGCVIKSESSVEFLQHASSEKIPPFILPHLFKETPFIDPLIELKGVSVAYEEKKVLQDIRWIIRPGEFWQLKGPNGSGKSTLLSMIIGDNPKGYGQELYLFGRKKGSGETVWDIKKNIGYFYPKMTELFKHNDTVENMIISGFVDTVGLYDLPSDYHKQIARSWLQVLGSGFQGKRFLELSTGQQRMVLVVRAAVKQPPLLILDEPTAGLDDSNAQLFISLIRAIASEKKTTIIYVSHRDEANLKPEKVFELIPDKDGSIGIFFWTGFTE
jgi:molybdate transport system ATP-binding protein